MTFNAGDVVMLKSGGQPLTVASVSSDEAVCLWIGEEGDLFRETIPLVALASLDALETDADEEENGGEADGEDDEEGQDDADEAADHDRAEAARA